MSISTRPYEGPDDLRLMQQLCVEAWPSQWHVGDLAWDRFHRAGHEPEWRTTLWLEEGRCVAWAWFRQPEGELAFLVHPKRRELTAEVVLKEDARSTSALAEDTQTVAVLERAGYVATTADEPFMVRLVRDLADLVDPVLEQGYELRHSPELAARVAVHRAAWEPSRLTEESYANVMRAWPYRADLDCVVVAPDGSLAAFCLAWLDRENGVGEFEPVGTHPDHRRRGLATAVSTYALHRLREAGAHTAVVYARGDAAYPAAKLLYESLAFVQHVRTRTFTHP